MSTTGFPPPMDIDPMETMRIKRFQENKTRDKVQKIDSNFKEGDFLR